MQRLIGMIQNKYRETILFERYNGHSNKCQNGESNEMNIPYDRFVQSILTILDGGKCGIW